MLVLTRQVGEKVVIDGTIVITVVAVKGDRVRLGVAAPTSVPVDRWEVHEQRMELSSGSPTLAASREPIAEKPARTAQHGDRVQVHYVTRLQDGSRTSSRGRAPLDPARAFAFDVDPVSLAVLRDALPGWDIDVVSGDTVGSLSGDWDPGAADLLIVGVRDNVADTLAMCRFLAFCTSYSPESRQKANAARGACEIARTRRADAPLLVLVQPGQEAFVGAALEAGAHRCLVQPIHAQEVASVLAHAQAGNQPGRHTLNLDKAQAEDGWRDDGGQG